MNGRAQKDSREKVMVHSYRSLFDGGKRLASSFVFRYDQTMTRTDISAVEYWKRKNSGPSGHIP